MGTQTGQVLIISYSNNSKTNLNKTYGQYDLTIFWAIEINL